jgi:hypothetical protein
VLNKLISKLNILNILDIRITIDSLGIIAKNIVDEMGEPSYTSGDHIWNGAAPILNNKAIKTNNKPILG